MPPVCMPATTQAIPTELIIDAHCHVFNGTDLPVAPFLKRVVNENREVPAAVMDLIADVLQTAVWGSAPGAAEERRAARILCGHAGQFGEGLSILSITITSTRALVG